MDKILGNTLNLFDIDLCKSFQEPWFKCWEEDAFCRIRFSFLGKTSIQELFLLGKVSQPLEFLLVNLMIAEQLNVILLLPYRLLHFHTGASFIELP